MSIAPMLAGMPAPDNSDTTAHVAQIKEVGDGVLITMSDGREIKVKPGDDIDIRPITRDTQVVTQGDPEPRSFRDLHNAGGLPDMIAAMLAARPQVLDPSAAPALAGAMAGAGGGPPGAQMPMLPDMEDALEGGSGAPGEEAAEGEPPAGDLAGFRPPPGMPPPIGQGPLGMPPGTPPSAAGPPGIPGLPPGMPGNLNVPMLPGMPPPGMPPPPRMQ
jgi:hypothetical protein